MTENKSLESSWCICEDGESLNESQYSNISSLNDELVNTLQTIKEKDLNASYSSDTQDATNKSKEDLDDIYDSYNVKINDLVQVLSAKNNQQMNSIVNSSKDKTNLRKAATFSKMNNITQIINKDKPVFERSNEQQKSIVQKNILNDLKNNSGLQDVVKLLSNKQKSFIDQAKNSEDIKSLADRVKELDEMDKIRRIRAFDDETKDFLADDENIIYTLDKLRDDNKKIPVEIVSPIHDEPNIKINELLDENQTNIQLMISKLKDKNRDFIEAIFDY